jgi:N-acetyl-anhydromuramyl-L-alanine amidase AmpD
VGKAWLTASLALWQRRLAYRKSRLEVARRQTPPDAARVLKWQGLVDEATRNVERRKDQLAELVIRQPPATVRESPNQSSRNGSPIRRIVLHSTEGNYDGAVSWLCNPQARASAHIVVGARGQTTRLVPDARKAWHVAADNPDTLGIEQEGYASQTAWPDAQLETVAQWLAWWGRKYGIPLEHSTIHGVCRHSDLGAGGGGHHDPGAGYPLARVLEMARRMS